jgi:glycosyltransferase involved in cell wall biosynthesis
MRPRLRLALAWDYLKHLFFWPIARLLRLGALLAKYRIPFVAERLNGLAGLIEQREYRKFAQGFGKSLSRVPRRIGKRLMRLGSTQFGHPAEALKGSGVEDALALGPVQPDASTTATTYGEPALPAPDGPVVLVLGSLSADALAITIESLASQTLRPRDVRVSVEDFACGPDDLVCIVAAGARLDPTSIELLAAVLLSAPLCKFAALTDTGEERIAACLMPSWIWRAHGRQALEIAPPEKSLDALGAAMTGVVGQGLVLPPPLAVWASTPGIGSNILAWNAVRATPDQGHVWSASPLDGAARLEASIGLRTARDGREAHPHLLIVVPWLPIGGSEIVLLEILEHVAERWAISIVTTLPSDHGMRPAFARLTDEIYHAGDVFDAFRLQAFVSGLITARSTRIVLSSNSGHLYRMVPELKAAHPQVAFVDILHNDLPNGHILNAVNAATSLERHVAVSRRVGEALIKRGVPRERVAVVPNGVDADVFSPQTCRSQARAAFKVEDETLVLAFVGRFSEEKRVDAFAEIVARVRRKMPVRAIVVGQGPGEAEFRARITAEDLPIEIIAKMPRFDLVSLYAAADVLVLTSTVEGMPMVVLEAMAAGCPAAVTNVGDLRRVIEPGVNGFLAPVDAPEMLADVIAAAASDPGRLSRMRTAAREAITSREMTKAAMLEGYDRLLNALGFDREGRTV